MSVRITVSKDGTRDFSDPRGTLLREHVDYVKHLRAQRDEARDYADRLFAARLYDYVFINQSAQYEQAL